jgi:tRNA-specific 2-thiouridylase
MATGHYVRNDISKLREAFDKTRDQSYFLSLVPKQNLTKLKFPLGNMQSKIETRNIGKDLGLHNFEKKDSQDICFIQGNNYKDFLNIASNRGQIVHIETNRILGEHEGLHNYTVGQRRGIAFQTDANLYVVRLDSKTNTVFVGERHCLQQKILKIKQVNWIEKRMDVFRADVKLRSNCIKIPAIVTKETEDKASVELLAQHETPIASGQICAVYDGEVIVGGGIIYE